MSFVSVRKLILSILAFFALLPFSFSKNISVSILGGEDLNNFSITIKRGSYSLKLDKKVYNLSVGNRVIIEHGQYASIGDSIRFKITSFKMIGDDYVNHFEVSLGMRSITYDDHLYVQMYKNQIRLINEVDLDRYVAGVVEGEAGYNLPLEYYKLQAILCRTYALKNLDRHSKDGFDLCDKVHCQVYHKKCKQNDIIKATASTSGLVVVDHDLELINTTFHSNCGGQTCNSEDVWITPVSYLRSVKDSFCHFSPHYLWEKKISQKDFITVFTQNKPVDSLKRQSLVSFCQDTARCPNKNLHSIHLTKVRSALDLKSTYFSVEKQGSNLTLYGKGFGHGVGLCQEGGMEMARRSYSYVDILKYYYTKVFIVNQRALLFFKEE
ncbi:MAG: hypothetical protein CMD20_04050 [Flavobacteriales bacterium]|nr:hypothetical protein [Flavobacteriales bacterium]